MIGMRGWDEPEEMREGQHESLELLESENADSDHQDELVPDISEDWYEDDPVAEVWKGGNEHLADTLSACFREIGIASRNLSEADEYRVVVRPKQETRAKEV